MSLRTPSLQELKTELISVMDYLPPSQPNTDAAGNIIRARAATTQSDEVRQAMTANMFVQLLETIGNRTPSDIEASALILKEINNLLDEYDAAIGPMLNLVEGEESFISVVRQEVADLTRNSFSGIAIPTNVSETPSSLKYSILSPFFPQARIRSISEGGGNPPQDHAFADFIGSVWGSFDDDGYHAAPQPNFIRDFETNQSEFFFPFKYMYSMGDYLAQLKATAIVFPDAFNAREGSPHSYVVKKSVRSEEIGILKPIMFDFTTSAAKGILASSGRGSSRAALIPRFVATDRGYERVFREVAGSTGDFARGTTNRENLQDWLNKPQNVFNVEAVGSLRDGFLSDTELAEELGLESSNLDPLQAADYVSFTEEVETERNDIFAKIRQIISNSELNSGVAGDFVPGVSPATSIQGGTAFRNCNFVAIKEGLGSALTHQNCIALAGLFGGDLTRILDRFQGAQRLFGQDWHLIAIREIAKYLIGILIGRSTPRATFVNPLTGEVTVQDNADPSVEENFRRIDRINASLEELRSRRTILALARSGLDITTSVIDPVNDFLGNRRRLSSLAMEDLTLIENASNSHERYSAYYVELMQGLIATGHCRWTSVERVFKPNRYIPFVEGERQQAKDTYSILFTDENTTYGGEPFTVEVEPNYSAGLEGSMRSGLEHILRTESGNVSRALLVRYADLNGEISDINDQIEELEAEIEEREIDNVELVVNSLVDNFPFGDTLSIGRGFETPENAARTLASSQYAGIVGFNESSTVVINPVEFLDPVYEPRPDDVEVPSESGFLNTVNAVLTELILDCSARIQAIPVELNRTDILNYAYAYFMLVGTFARDAMLVEVDSSLTDDIRGFENKILTPRRTIAIFAKDESEIISAAALAPNFQRNYSNAVGLGNQAPEGQIQDPYRNSLEYVQELSDLLTQTLAPGFATASEALLTNIEALRRVFARSIAIGGSDLEIPLDILDVLLRSNDFRDFADRARRFIRSKSLIPIILLSTNDVTASLSLLQFALYTLTQSSMTKIDTFSASSSEVQFNKVCSVGIHKDLEKLIEDIIPSADVERIKRDIVKIQLLERQLDPSPSGIDTLLADSDEFLEYGSKYLQSTPSFGQPPGGFKYLIGLNQDYKFLVENFSISNPVVKVTRDIINPVLPRREFEINLRRGSVSESFRTDEVDDETKDSIVTFLRSEALKIYYYFMTGLLFEPTFAPNPDNDDSIITRNLISANPITRLRALLDLVAASDINQFSDIVLTPFISDNDSIEEFSAKIIFLT